MLMQYICCQGNVPLDVACGCGSAAEWCSILIQQRGVRGPSTAVSELRSCPTLPNPWPGACSDYLCHLKEVRREQYSEGRITSDVPAPLEIQAVRDLLLMGPRLSTICGAVAILLSEPLWLCQPGQLQSIASHHVCMSQSYQYHLRLDEKAGSPSGDSSAARSQEVLLDMYRHDTWPQSCWFPEVLQPQPPSPRHSWVSCSTVMGDAPAGCCTVVPPLAGHGCEAHSECFKNGTITLLEKCTKSTATLKQGSALVQIH